MAIVQYTCDACDARFDIDAADIPEEGPMCPECAETELLTVAGFSNGSSCQVIPGTTRRT